VASPNFLIFENSNRTLLGTDQRNIELRPSLFLSLETNVISLLWRNMKWLN
jgi:hypothetical protein